MDTYRAQSSTFQDLQVVVQMAGQGVRARADLALPRSMQRTLVPPVTFRDTRVEAYGRSIPHDTVGGDLVDLVKTNDDVVAYVADISGHGMSAGVLMGMVKTAVRYGLQFDQELPEILDGMNRVLPSVKEPGMYATFAGLRFNDSGEVEYIAAGHVPLLHYRRAQGDVVRHSMEQFPVGLVAEEDYASNRLRFEPGDVFAIVTDGIVETMAGEEEFGLQRLEHILCEFAGRSLPDIFQAAVAAVNCYGTQQDDQTLMLVRVLG